MALFHNDLPCSKKKQVGDATNSQVCIFLSTRQPYTFTMCIHGTHTRTYTHTHTHAHTAYAPNGFRLAKTKEKVALRKCLRGRRGNAR